MSRDRDGTEIVIVSCCDCGPVPVATSTFEIHADQRDDIALYAFTCPRCGEVGSGGCRDLIAHLAAAGVRRRELRSVDAAPLTDAEVGAFRRWLETDPVWDLPEGT